jgi:Na+/proline symporter
MVGCIVLAILVVKSDAIGGIVGLKTKLPSWSLSFFPEIGTDSSGIGTTLSIGIGAFFARIGVQWWSSWYPGAEPGGGGYVAQRMMSCKDEKNAVYATLFFQIMHYCIRPWPWILVGLCAIVLYPQLGENQKEMGFVLAMKDYLPVGMKGLLLAAFFAAYMSTVATQLNWGASYLVNDFYKRFVNKNGTEKDFVNISRLATLLVMVASIFVTFQISTIENAWGFIIECGAGLGLVLILRWYWWRINAYAEIAATVAPFFIFAFTKFLFHIDFPNSFFITVGGTTMAWLLVMFLTQPESKNTLDNFYNKVRPAGFWHVENKAENSSLPYLFLCWISATILTYCFLFGIGSLIFLEYSNFMLYLLVFAICLLILKFSLSKAKVLD